MPSTLDWTPTEALQILLFGRYKTGKTFGALTFPRPVVLDFDRGIATSRNPEFVKKWGLRDIQYEQFTDKVDSKGIPLSYDAFDTACRYFDEWMKLSGTWKGAPTGRDRFDTWVIDSGTTLSTLANSKAIILLGAGGGKTKAASSTWAQAKNTGLIAGTKQDYGAERSMMEQFIKMVKDSGKHVILISHEKELRDNDGLITDVVPTFTGQSVERIPLMFDEVWRAESRPEGMSRRYHVRTHQFGTYKVGTRYGVPDETLWNFDAVTGALATIRSEQLAQAKKAKEQSNAGNKP